MENTQEIVTDTSIDTNFEFPIVLKVFIALFSIICIFISVDFFVITPSQLVISRLFLDGFINSKFFSLLDILVICICCYFAVFYKLSFKNASPLERFFFYFSVICFILKLANPNNRSENPIFGLPLLSEIGNYSYFMFFATIISIPKSYYFLFVKKIFIYSTWVVVLRCIVLLILFFLGQSKAFFFGIKSCLLEGDTLLILGLFQSVIFALYLSTKQRNYLLIWILLLLVQVFSSRRSPLFTALFCNMIVFGFYYVRKMNIVSKSLTILVIVFSVFVLPGVVSTVSPKAKVYIDRYMGVFSSDSYSTDPANSDSGHFEQSKLTTQAALKTGFWGVGYGNKLILEGAFSINGEFFVHNVFAALWAMHGVYMVVFYLLIILAVFWNFIKLLMSNAEAIFYLVLIKMSVLVFFLMYMNAMYYTTINFIVSTKMEYILLLVIVFILKFGEKDFIKMMPDIQRDWDKQNKEKSGKYIAF